MYEVVLANSARIAFEDANAALQRRLDRCFVQLAREPRRHNNGKALQGRLAGRFRYRVGDHRVIYSIDDAANRVVVLVIANRKDVYE